MGQRTLKDIRLAAGWRSARAFAEHVGIPVSTYSVYEKDPGSIRLDAARSIARELGCSVAELAGDPAPAPDPGPVQRAYDGLGEESREQADAFLALLAKADARARGGAVARAHALGLYEAYAEDYASSRGLFDGPGDREGFRSYVEGRLAERRDRDAEKAFRDSFARLDAAFSTGGAEREDIAEELVRLRKDWAAELAEEDASRVEMMIEMYDSEHAEK